MLHPRSLMAAQIRFLSQIPFCSTGRWPMRIGFSVNVFDRLFCSRGLCKSSDKWRLIRTGNLAFLPLAVPFDLSSEDLTPAVQSCFANEIEQAARFTELTRLAGPSSSYEQWRLRLIEAALLLQLDRSDLAWNLLQSALAWRNLREEPMAGGNLLPVISPREWLTMATIALAADKPETAEAYASEAVARIENARRCCMTDLLCDTRADAMTVYSAIRLSQQRFYEAEMLLQLSRDAYVQAGDMEQLVVSLILLADVEFHSGGFLEALSLLCECDRILTNECDASRHVRLTRLRLVIQQRSNNWRGTRRRVLANQNMN